MEAVATYSTALSPNERWELTSYESVIERGLKSFVEVGSALLQIRDGKLYRTAYATFEDYCQTRWGLNRNRAYQLMDAAGVVHSMQMSTMVDMPQNERQARALVQVEPEQRPVVMQAAAALASGGKVTTAHIEQAKHAIIAPVPPVTVIDRLAVHYSSESEEWYTPPEIIAPVVEFFDEIDLDPCSNSRTHPNVPAREVFTKEDDGLRQEWHGRVFLNPPYKRAIIDLWIEKLLIEYNARRIEQAIALVPARTETDWFSGLYQFPLLFISYRLHFTNPDGRTSGAPFPSVLALIGTDIDAFKRCFGHLGPIVTEYRT